MRKRTGSSASRVRPAVSNTLKKRRSCMVCGRIPQRAVPDRQNWFPPLVRASLRNSAILAPTSARRRFRRTPVPQPRPPEFDAAPRQQPAVYPESPGLPQPFASPAQQQSAGQLPGRGTQQCARNRAPVQARKSAVAGAIRIKNLPIAPVRYGPCQPPGAGIQQLSSHWLTGLDSQRPGRQLLPIIATCTSAPAASRRRTRSTHLATLKYRR